MVAKHKRGRGRPRTTGAGANRVQYRVSDAQLKDLGPKPNMEAKRRAFPAESPSREIKTVYDPTE